MCANASECPYAEPACSAAQYCPRVPDFEFAYVGRISREEAVNEDGTDE